MPSPASMVKLMKALGLKTDDLIRASDPQAVEAINAKLSRKGGTPTEQDVFQEIARLNAAMPTQQGGLGMGVRNTAQERARGLGFDTDVYHGTQQVFDNFDIKQTSPSVQYMRGIFTTPDPEKANVYASDGIVMPLLQRKGYTILDKTKDRRAGRPVQEVDSINDVERQIRVTNKPENIRSRFAAFDPARVNENNLLASRLLPFALPGLLALPTDEE